MDVKGKGSPQGGVRAFTFGQLCGSVSAMSDEYTPMGTEQCPLTKSVIAVHPLMDAAENGPRQTHQPS